MSWALFADVMYVPKETNTKQNTIGKRFAMTKEQSLIAQARNLLYKHGQKGLNKAREIMRQEEIPYQPLQEAVQYFMASWEDVLHPALLSLSCEAVGGKPEATVNIASAFVLLAGSADLHDDVIDQSSVKDSKPTVYGKFGKDLTVLAGEVLLFKGLYTLHEACEKLDAEQKVAILKITKQAFLQMSSAEAKESSLHGQTDVVDQYFEMIKMKSAVSQATMKIGAILGQATPEKIEVLGNYGKVLSLISILRDEFIDSYEINELKNRYKNECLPFPILLAMTQPATAKRILKHLRGGTGIKNVDTEVLWASITSSKKIKMFMKEVKSTVNNQKLSLRIFRFQKDSLELLLNCHLEDL